MDVVGVIETAGLTKRYPRVTALDELTVDIGEGVTGLVGANGAGKSTLIKILLGLIPGDASGRAHVLGLDVATDGAEIRALVGYMPEHDCLPPDVSATEFVVHMGRMSGLPYPAARERAADTLRHVGLDEERYRPIGGYSTGMKQRVKLAQALVHDPRLVLLDEPTNGLDPASRDDMLALIRRIGTDFGIAVLVTSHLLGELERISDHVVVIDGGRLLRSSATTRLQHRHRHPAGRGQGRTDADRTARPGAGRARACGAEPGRRPDGRGRDASTTTPTTWSATHRRPRPRPGPDGGAAPPHRGRLPRGRCAAVSSPTDSRGPAASGGHPRHRLPPLRRAAPRPRLRSPGRSSSPACAAAFGLGRSARSKVLPMVLFAVMLLPALILVGVLVQAKDLLEPRRADRPLLDVPDHHAAADLRLRRLAGTGAVSRDLRFRTITALLLPAQPPDDYVLAGSPRSPWRCSC